MPYGLFYAIVEIVPDLQKIAGKNLLGYSGFCLLMAALVYSAKKVALKEYGMALPGILWSFLWRILIALPSLIMFFVFEAAAMGQAGSFVGVVLTALVLGSMLLGAFGWAFHRQLEMPVAGSSGQVWIVILAVIAVAGIVKFNSGEEYIHGYNVKESDLVGTWLHSVDSMPGAEAGFSLKSGGEAKSVNMAALACLNWRLDEDEAKLELDCVSAGGRDSSAARIVYNLVAVSSKHLLLKDSAGMILTYRRGE